MIRHNKHSNVGCFGGNITYMITPTGIGDICEIKCNTCNKILKVGDDLL